MSHECVDKAHENGAHVDVLKSTEHDDPTGNLMSDFSDEGVPEEGEVEDGEIDDEDTNDVGKLRPINADLINLSNDVNPTRSYSSEENHQNHSDSNRSRKREKHKKKRDKHSHGKHSNDRSHHHGKRSHGDDGKGKTPPHSGSKRAQNGRTSESKSWYDDVQEDLDDDMMGVYGRPPPKHKRSPVYYGNDRNSEDFRSRSPSISGSTADSIGKKERLMDYISGDDDTPDIYVASHEKEEMFRSRDDPKESYMRDQRKRQRRTKKTKDFMQRRRQREGQGNNHRNFVHGEKQQCKYYMEGRCGKAESCPFSHDFKPPKKQELCKFYAISTCLKGEHCVYLHEEFPCKFYHTGNKFCREDKDCKFSHAPLTQLTKNLMERFVEERMDESIVTDDVHEKRPFSLNDDDEETVEYSEEKKNSLLGTPPAHMKNVQHRNYDDTPEPPTFGSYPRPDTDESNPFAFHRDDIDESNNPFAFHRNDKDEQGDFEMRGMDGTNNMSSPDSRSNNFFNNQGNFAPRGPGNQGGPMPRMMGGHMRGNMGGPMRHLGGHMRHSSGPMGHHGPPGPGNMGMGHPGMFNNQADGGMNMGGQSYAEHDNNGPHSGHMNRMGGPDNMPRMINPSGPMIGPHPHMFPMRGPPPMNQSQPPPFMPNCPPPGMQTQMPPRFRARMHMGAPPGGIRHAQPRGVPPPQHMQQEFMSNQLDKIAELFMAGKEAAEKISSEDATADEKEDPNLKQESSVEPVPEDSVPPGAYVPQSSAVLPSVRLGDVNEPTAPEDALSNHTSQLMGVPTCTTQPISQSPELPSPNITGSSPLGLCGNLNQAKEPTWILIPLDVPVKIPYPLMQLPNDVPHLHNDPRLKGQAGVLRAGKEITGRRTSDSNIPEEGFSPIVPSALLEKPPSLKEFRIDNLTIPAPDTLTDDSIQETPLIASPSPSHKPYQLQLNEMSTTFLQDSSASGLQTQMSRSDRSYLADPRFRRRKANTGTSPRNSGDVGELNTASSPTS